MKEYKQPRHTGDRHTDQQLIIEFFHRIIMHHAFWFVETQKKLGNEKALEMLSKVFKTSFGFQMKRLGRQLGFEVDNEGIPSFFNMLSEEQLSRLRDDMAVNWLANDGIWFQAVEQQEGMATAKHCNDEAWRQLSPTEGHLVKKMLGMQEKPGIKGLMKALKYRLYWFINEQSFRDVNETSFVFTNDNCRVQSARERKDLEHYPCKSAGYIEYSTFAKAIDPRIRTSVVFCPPDKEERAFYCGWKFTLDEK